MTVSLCTNCGSLKHGAWCVCPTCNAESFDGEISILLSDHNLTDKELKQIGRAVAEIYGTDLDEETRFHALLYFLSRKWPKLIAYDIDQVEPSVKDALDAVYRERLVDMPSQESPDTKVPLGVQSHWTHATGKDFQADDEAWQAEVKPVLMEGFAVAKQVVVLHIEAGEGAVLQKIVHLLQCAVKPKSYRAMLGKVDQFIGDAKEYQRNVDRFCSAVKNGWSERTKEQAAYLRGTCHRLLEMADSTKKIIEHKAGANRLIGLDFRRVRQEFDRSYKAFIDVACVAGDPARIKPDGTCSPC